MKIHRTLITAAILSVLPVIGGCTTYYRISDPSTGKTYYTTGLAEKSGSTTFVDAKTGAQVSIQNSEVNKVTKEEFETARSQR